MNFISGKHKTFYLTDSARAYYPKEVVSAQLQLQEGDCKYLRTLAVLRRLTPGHARAWSRHMQRVRSEKHFAAQGEMFVTVNDTSVCTCSLLQLKESEG
jgi:hypothetical protein